jgi:hypothetical protein
MTRDRGVHLESEARTELTTLHSIGKAAAGVMPAEAYAEG